MNRRRVGLILSIIILVCSILPVYAKTNKCRLRDCLQEEYMYYTTTVSKLNSAQSGKSFKDDYDNRYVVVQGSLDDISNNAKSATLSDKDGDAKCKLDTSEKNIVDMLSGKSSIEDAMVYAKLNVSSIGSNSYELIVKKLVINPQKSFSNGSYVFYKDNEIQGTTISDLTADKRVIFDIPQSWTGSYVSSQLKNNGVNGYQYYLNAIEPQHLDYPEIFYVFYFENETYLKDQTENPTNGDYKDIEATIIKDNILKDISKDMKVTVSDIKDANGTNMHYYETSYRPKDGNDYRLEFIFRPDSKGITCMLYLYFPKESAVNHVEEVAYVIENMQIKDGK